jgi:hypothetical protein
MSPCPDATTASRVTGIPEFTEITRRFMASPAVTSQKPGWRRLATANAVSGT